MLLLTLKYRHTVYHRTAPDVYGETEHSHTSIEVEDMFIVVPDNTDRSINMARATLDHHAGNSNDPAYELLNVTHSGNISYILHSPVTRI